eukprot:3493265-Rhodomonas_salina.2
MQDVTSNIDICIGVTLLGGVRWNLVRVRPVDVAVGIAAMVAARRDRHSPHPALPVWPRAVAVAEQAP